MARDKSLVEVRYTSLKFLPLACRTKQRNLNSWEVCLVHNMSLILRNQMEKNMENEMETGLYGGLWGL